MEVNDFIEITHSKFIVNNHYKFSGTLVSDITALEEWKSMTLLTSLKVNL